MASHLENVNCTATVENDSVTQFLSFDTVSQELTTAQINVNI